jgi:toxin ParE1/3/4
MIWAVNYTEHAKQDLRDIQKYISETLLAAMTADKQVKRIMAAADSLSHMPMRYRLYDREPWLSQGLRIMPVDNYVVLYIPNEVMQMVTIIRVIYGGRDISLLLP